MVNTMENNKIKVITSVGYSCTGSSSINNYFMEFSNCKEITPHNECRFLQDPDGVADLDYNLFANRHRLNSGYAIKKYWKYATKYDGRNFRQIFGKKWFDITKEYIDSIIDFKYHGYWHADIRDFNVVKKTIYYTRRGVRKVLNKIVPIPECVNYFPKMYNYFPISSREEFLEKTKKYCSELFDVVNTEGKEFVIVDQLVPPTNIETYLEYVDNMKVIVVDRDPRDIYIECIEINDRAFPKDVDLFCKLHKKSREIKKCMNKEKVLYINFEDLIYKYDDTTKRILEFTGEKEEFHVNKYKYFSIEKSKENTMLWKKNHKYDKEIKIIERELAEYLYDVR